MKIISEIFFDGKKLIIEKTNDSNYQVIVNGVIKHPDCSAEDVMRVLSHYLSK